MTKALGGALKVADNFALIICDGVKAAIFVQREATELASIRQAYRQREGSLGAAARAFRGAHLHDLVKIHEDLAVPLGVAKPRSTDEVVARIGLVKQKCLPDLGG